MALTRRPYDYVDMDPGVTGIQSGPYGTATPTPVYRDYVTPTASSAVTADYDVASYDMSFGLLGSYLGPASRAAMQEPIVHTGEVLYSGGDNVGIGVSIDYELTAKASTFGTPEYFRRLYMERIPFDEEAFNTTLDYFAGRGPQGNTFKSALTGNTRSMAALSSQVDLDSVHEPWLKKYLMDRVTPSWQEASWNSYDSASYSSVRPPQILQDDADLAARYSNKYTPYIYETWSPQNYGIEDLTFYARKDEKLAPIGMGGISYSPIYSSYSFSPTFRGGSY